jgi:hypothetical protein
MPEGTEPKTNSGNPNLSVCVEKTQKLLAYPDEDAILKDRG